MTEEEKVELERKRQMYYEREPKLEAAATAAGVCGCECHVDDQRVFCSCFGPPCCDLIYQKYFTVDAVFDQVRYDRLKRILKRQHEMQVTGSKRGKCPVCGRRYNKRGRCSVCDDDKERK